MIGNKEEGKTMSVIVQDGGEAIADAQPIATISGGQPVPESEMDALLLGRTGVRHV